MTITNLTTTFRKAPINAFRTLAGRPEKMEKRSKAITLSEVIKIRECMQNDIAELIVKMPLIVSERHKLKRMNELKKIDLFYCTPVKI